MAVLEKVLKPLRDRLKELEKEIAAREVERDQITTAIAVLSEKPSSTSGPRKRSRRQAAREGTGRAKPGPRAGSKRAPRGENQRKILAAVANGAKTVREVADETGIKKETVSTTLNVLAKRGRVTKNDGRFQAVSG